MKLAKEIADEVADALLSDNRSGDDCILIDMGGVVITDEGMHRMESVIAAKLGPVRETLEKIAHYNHSDDCDGWHNDTLGRINPDTGSVYKFNSCPVYECDCPRNAGGMNQWELADRALTLLFYD